MNRLTIIAAAAVALLSVDATFAENSDGSPQADRELERSIVAKGEPLDHFDLRSLSAISGRRVLEDATLNRITRKIAAGLDLREAKWVEILFVEYQKAARLPEPTFRFLTQNMAEVGPSSYVSADALKTLPASDERRSIALSALAEALNREQDDKRAVSLLAHIERFDRHGPLNRNAVRAVAATAASERDFPLRKRAIKLLRGHELDAEQRLRIYRSLLPEIDTGFDPYSKESRQTQFQNRELSYVLEMLTAFAPRPYPPELVDQLTVNFPRHAALSLPVIVAYGQTAEFSDRQRELLVRWATDYESSIYSRDYAEAMEMRLTLFRALWPAPTADDVAAAIAALEDDRSEEARRKALYDIRRFYDGAVVPGPVVNRLTPVLLGSQSEELRFVGATLILGGDVALAAKEEKILAMIAQRTREHQLYALLLDRYDAGAMQSLVTRYARDKTLPTSFREEAIRRLGTMAAPGLQLSAESTAQLEATVLLDDDIRLGTAENTLEQWGVEPPVSERQQVRDRNQTMANIAGVITLVFTFVAPVVFIIGLAVIPMAVSRRGGNLLGKLASVVGWVLLAGASLLAWGYAVFGSYGIHGSGAPPEKHFAIMAPFHLVSAIALIVLIACMVGLFRSRSDTRNEVGPA